MKNEIIHLLLSGACLFFVTICSTQTSLTGSVTDSGNQEPLIGASVVIANTSNGTITDNEGNFQIETTTLPVDLIISYIGYIDKIVTVTNAVQINIELTSGINLGDVLVTAQKRPENSKDVPIALSVLDGQVLQEQGFYSLEIASQIMPNVNVVNSGTSPSIAIRGISTSGANNGFEQSVGTFVDGVYIGRSNYMKTQLFDIEQIEVLKGPQPTYFGNSTIGGAMSISSVKPGKKQEGYVALSTGTQSEYELEGAYTYPFSDDFRIRVAAKYRTFDGFLNDLQTGDLKGGDKQLSGRITAVLEPSDRFKFTLKAEIADRTGEGGAPPRWRDPRPMDPSEAINGYLYDDFDPNYDLSYRLESFTSAFGANRPLPTEATFAGRPIAVAGLDKWHENPWFADEANDINAANLSGNFEIGLGGGYSLTSLTGYSTFETFQRGDIDASHYALFGNQLAQDFNQFSQEIRLQSPTDKKVYWNLGAYYQNTTFSSENGSVMPIFGASGGGTIQDDSWFSVFANMDYSLTDQLKLSGGLRYSTVSKDGEVYSVWGLSSVTGMPMSNQFPMNLSGNIAINNGEIPLFERNPNGVFYDPTYDTDAVDYSLSLLYELNENNNVYLKYAKGFKAGGINAPAVRVTPTTQETFGDETANAFELGVKGSIPAINLKYNLAAFQTNIEGLQVNQYDPINFNFITSNAGEAVSKGIEFDSRIFFSEVFQLGIDMAFLDAEFTEFITQAQNEEIADGLATQVAGQNTPAPNDDVYTVDRAGYPLKFSPDFQITLSPTFNFSLNDKSRIFVNAQYTYKTRYATSDVYYSYDFQDAYGELYANVGYGPKDRKWNVNAYFRNITDEIYIVTANNGNGFIGRGNRMGVQFRYNF